MTQTADQRHEHANRVVDFGVEAAQALARTNMAPTGQIAMLTEGLAESAGKKPEAVLYLLGVALLRLAERANADADFRAELPDGC